MAKSSWTTVLVGVALLIWGLLGLGLPLVLWGITGDGPVQPDAERTASLVALGYAAVLLVLLAVFVGRLTSAAPVDEVRPSPERLRRHPLPVEMQMYEPPGFVVPIPRPGRRRRHSRAPAAESPPPTMPLSLTWLAYGTVDATIGRPVALSGAVVAGIVYEILSVLVPSPFRAILALVPVMVVTSCMALQLQPAGLASVGPAARTAVSRLVQSVACSVTVFVLVALIFVPMAVVLSIVGIDHSIAYGAAFFAAYVLVESRMFVALPAVIAERRGPLAAARRSWRLTRGNTVRTAALSGVVFLPTASVAPFHLGLALGLVLGVLWAVDAALRIVTLETLAVTHHVR